MRPSYLKPNRTVTYFRSASGKRVPARVVSNVLNVAVLKLADGTTVAAVLKQTGRQHFGTWGHVRHPDDGIG